MLVANTARRHYALALGNELVHSLPERLVVLMIKIDEVGVREGKVSASLTRAPEGRKRARLDFLSRSANKIDSGAGEEVHVDSPPFLLSGIDRGRAEKLDERELLSRVVSGDTGDQTVTRYRRLTFHVPRFAWNLAAL